ncbi:GIN domain-containing protein [Legionella oakridgensis]|uniref:Putative auto-transporter adhesin head GIN domain-containing protein n=2 Tax=Legionella oakridgensis TaxID=29423 RepID=W0BI96_9GAMM|nr:DUF2807 domain-containing protein [Legionella oakridgensis]AHE68317.1 hypothetical protein Loa_02787 [Legionella oakridgensis ATCC 33761 = DSM 21215]ETO92235.1 hypothetical protein LOR_89c25050 [Legionella oakridgensis RV-2-2007]KTD39008.1 hypothetical protein Loak_1129 [Legionella oakridgensis]STY21264.1 Protein of uncharacterised function (DUF2807) [Legionella longbeachae]
MLKRSFLLILSALLLTSCGRHPVTSSPVQQAQQIRPVSTFTRVKVTGNINVSLHTGYSRPQVILRGDPRDLAFIATRVVQGTLFVELSGGLPHYGAVHAEIRGRYLNSFVYKGTGVITGTKLRSSLLDIVINNKGSTTLGGYLGVRRLEISGNGQTQINDIHSQALNLKLAGATKVRLSGVVNVTSLNVEDNAQLSLYWVKSNILKIRGRDQAYIQLAGIVDKLLVELCDSAHFNGRYLRANRTFIKTHDRSVAEISSVDRQHTLASDASNIYFYNIPEMKTDYMAFNGSVLDMRDWNMPFMQEYNRYNK